MKRTALLLAGLFAFSQFAAFPCTTFVMQGDGRVYFGRNLDWSWDQGMVIVNPRNVRKRAFVMSTNAVTWTSKYGSVTFNQFGREQPFGGMNEAGLVIENMWLTETQYPPTDQRPEINMLQWIQYQLDTCKTVKDVLKSDKKIRLENTPVRARIHYLVSDAKGHVATIEFLNGTMVVHSGKQLPFTALANDPYDPSVKYAGAQSKSSDLTKPLAHTDSLPRFCRAGQRAASFKAAKNRELDIAYAFETLEQVRQGSYTAWQIVYDVSRREIQFRTRSNPKIRFVNLKDMDFSCNRPIQFVDIQANAVENGKLVFHDLQETDLRNYLTGFASRQDVQQTVGDIRPMIEPMLMVLKTYSCTGK